MLFKKVFQRIYFRNIYTKVFDLKYVKTTGVKGIRNRKFKEDVENEEDFENESKLDLEDIEYDTIAESVFQVSRSNIVEQRVLVIQPFVKWGPNKKATKPELQIQEAESLIHSIQNWEVKESLKVPLESLGKKALFGKGKMEELKSIIKSHNSKGKPITSIFVSIGVLSFAQRQNLTNELKLLILDRYSVVIQILRLHAISTESKIQVALAEIPYIWNHLKAANTNISTQMYHLSDGQKQILRSRERKLRNELEKVRNHRKLLRKKRQQKDIPLVSVVGYTNAGKTSLIKALTNSSTLQPRNQLFATLDVTAHAGLLPSNLQIIYMDTVGFMSDLPTGLIECFVATLEDVLLSDLIIHVQDVSHENVEEQRNHVEITLKNLFHSLDKNEKIPPILNVGNKIDLVPNYSGGDLKLISSKTSVGQNDLLEAIEEKILENTNRQKKILRVRNGGPEIAWLYKNAAVTSVVADQKDSNYLLVKIVINDTSMFKFKKEFLRN